MLRGLLTRASGKTSADRPAKCPITTYGGRVISASSQEAVIPVDVSLLEQAAQHLGLRRWAEAAELYARVLTGARLEDLSPQDQLRRNLALNMTDLRQHRPEIFRLVESSPTDKRFVLDVTPAGRLSVAYVPPVAPGAAPLPAKRLCEGNDPLAHMAAVMQALKAEREGGHPLILLGSGDGYVLMNLARHPPELAMGRQQCIHYMEPNVGNLVACMMIHDMSGDRGPIRQARFQWWVGEDCTEQFRNALVETDPALPFPVANVAMLPSGPTLAKRLDAILQDLLATDLRRQQRLEARDRVARLDRLIDATSDRPSRKPRVLVLTTRQSTVLQFSAADTAEAFGRLGWDAKLVIEPTAYHTLTLPLIRDTLLKHDPDLVLQIDHFRAEHGHLFSPNVPFVNWIQDNLPNLTNPQAGAAQGPLDFSLSALGDWYVNDYGYPAANMIPIRKLTKVCRLPEDWESDGADFVFVSNASKLPEVAADELVQFYGNFPDLAKVARGAADRLLAAYAEGQSPIGSDTVGRFVTASATDCGIDPAALPKELTIDLVERVANVAYRQQALGWVADLAREKGYTLELYGKGWDKHPNLAEFARGYAAYGEPLERLTRAAKINLQIVHVHCLHQRLLDGLSAGGFFLVRSHPSDLAIPALLDFVEHHVPPQVRSLAEARRVLRPELLPELERHAAANAYLADRLDLIAMARNVKSLDMLGEDNRPVPVGIEETSFSSPAELRQRAARFLPDAALRRRVALEQRASVVEKLSYEAGMKKVVAAVHARLKALQKAGVGPGQEVARSAA